jgi:L-alanine-DL-glutamate epimerase-like enolase superfamily enzyme
VAWVWGQRILSRDFPTLRGSADGFPVQDSYVKLPEIPGIGFEAKAELYSVMSKLAKN